MKQAWTRFAAWFQALKPREQWVVGIAAVLVGAALMDAALLSPVSSRRLEAERAFATVRGQIQTIQEQVAALRRNQAEDPNAGLRARIEELRQAARGVDDELRSRSGEFVTAEQVRPLLERLLASRPTLQLVELRTLASEPLGAPAEPAAPGPTPPAGTSNGTAAQGLYRHGLEIAVRGSYADLFEYIREIERLPVRVYWRRIELSSDTWPNSIVRLTLHTLSLDRTWLAV